MNLNNLCGKKYSSYYKCDLNIYNDYDEFEFYFYLRFLNATLFRF